MLTGIQQSTQCNNKMCFSIESVGDLYGLWVHPFVVVMLIIVYSWPLTWPKQSFYIRKTSNILFHFLDCWELILYRQHLVDNILGNKVLSINGTLQTVHTQQAALFNSTHTIIGQGEMHSCTHVKERYLPEWEYPSTFSTTPTSLRVTVIWPIYSVTRQLYSEVS